MHNFIASVGQPTIAVVVGFLIIALLLAFSQAATYGVQTIDTLGRDVSPFAGIPEYKPGGITIDWSTVSALGSDTTDAVSGRIFKSGDKYLAAGTVLTRITANGKWGAYASGASDGRQTLTPGDCFILCGDVANSDPGSDHPPVADGGRAWYDRVIAVATNPTGSTLRNAFPRVAWINTAG